jgi:epsilon-lactone hydrolase
MQALHDPAPRLSWRARLVIGLLSHRHWLRLKRRPVITARTDLADLRARAQRSTRRFGRVPADVRIEPDRLAGVPVEWLRPADARPGRLLLHFHGGGYVMGSCATHRALVARIARAARSTAVLFDYRLAPEWPFPAALDDALAVVRQLDASGWAVPEQVWLGDSAGGGLCLASLLARRDAGATLPAAAALVSPWVDLSCSRPSHRGTDLLSPAGAWTVFARHYAGDTPLTHPLLSPLWAGLRGLPPLLLQVGTREVLHDEVVLLDQRLRAAGGDSQLTVGAGMPHCWALFAPSFPEATHAHDELVAFLREPPIRRPGA